MSKNMKNMRMYRITDENGVDYYTEATSEVEAVRAAIRKGQVYEGLVHVCAQGTEVSVNVERVTRMKVSLYSP